MAVSDQKKSSSSSYLKQRPVIWTELPRWLRYHFSDTQRYLILWILVGLICGLVAVAFHLSIQFTFQTIWNISQKYSIHGLPWLMIVFPTIAGLLVGIILHKLSPNSAGSGIPQTKKAYYLDFGVFKLRDAIWRFILGTISVGGGISLGREGPTVHICAAIASKIGQVFGLAKKRVQAMVPIGMGAGIAAAFNAPLAGMFFVYEELLGDFSTKAMFGILVSVVIAAATERFCLGEHPAFDLVLPEFETSWWMLICIPLGIFAAFTGHFWVNLLLQVRLWIRDQVTLPVWLKPAIGGLLISIIGLAIYMMTGRHGIFSIGYRDLSDVLNGQLLSFKIIFLLFAGKFLASIIAYGSGGSGGVFAPTLFIGGMLGSLFGLIGFHFFGFDSSVIGALALLGMGAFFAAVIRCPLTSIMIIFEMTRSYALILPLMAGNILAYFLAVKLRRVPLYDALLLQDKISLRKLPDYQGEQDWQNLPVSTIMTFDLFNVEAALNAAENLKELGSIHRHAYPVIGKNLELLGVITHHELIQHSWEKPDEPTQNLLRKKEIVYVHPETSIRDAANIMVTSGVQQVAVVSIADKRKILGIVTIHDIARQQNAISEVMGR